MVTDERVCKALCAYAQLLQMDNFWARTVVCVDHGADRVLSWNPRGFRAACDDDFHDVIFDLHHVPSLEREQRMRNRQPAALQNPDNPVPA